MNILDLFSGVGGFAKAFEETFGTDHQHYYSDVDKYALAVYKYQFPNAIALGDVTKIDASKLPTIDFMFAGFPCQNLSIAGNRLGLEGVKSGLFYNTVELWKQVKPKYWIFENVASMKKEEKQKITDILGVEAVMINSSLVSGQNRKRYFWCSQNFGKISQPQDRHIYLKDILESGEGDRLKSYCLDASYYKETNLEQYLSKSRRQIVFEKPNKLCHINKSDSQGNRVYGESGKSVTLASQSGGLGAKTGLYRVAMRNRGEGKKPEIGYDNKANSLTTVQSDSMVLEPSTFSLSNSRQNLSITANNKSNCLTSSFRGNPDGNGRPGVIIPDQYVIRKLTPIETNRLQTFPDNWNSKGIFETKNGLEVKDISSTQRYKQMGNAVTVEVIKHILKAINNQNNTKTIEKIYVYNN